ncbi:hypothetical protein DSO57_1019588 [Entomophthora muscae]|uniref:Uncharacterized protein n=1 Tax=Entomophthora muscae TaxID=34485 RepID=A0ACC2SH35_9FUNG|nr:hypothetical protein DSO57_1019588 [Entomophthora muscae]
MVPNSRPWSLLGQSHSFYGGLHPAAQPHPILSRPMTLPMPGFLKLGVLDQNSLFSHQMMADLFAQMVFHVNMGNQSHKDKRLPPRATDTYQPIKAMTDEEYGKQ